MLARVPAEVVEGAFVRIEELTEGLTEARLVEAPPRVAQGQDEHVEHDGAAPEVDAGLPPVDLALLSRRRLEAHRRALRGLLHGPQRPHEALHGLIAAVIPARLAELLEQDAGRVLDLGCPRLEVARMLGKQRIDPLGPDIRLPRRLQQNPAHRLPIQG